MTGPALDRSELQALAFLPRAALVTAGFGTVWSYAGVGAWTGPEWLMLLSMVPGLGLLGLALRSARASRAALRTMGVDRAEVRWSPARRRRYWIIVATEAIVIVAVASLLPRAELGWMLVPAVSLVVGLHFFPLGALLGNRFLHLIGGILTLWSVVVMVALPPSPGTQSFAAGVGAGVVLLVGSARNLVEASVLRRRLASTEGR